MSVGLVGSGSPEPDRPTALERAPALLVGLELEGGWTIDGDSTPALAWRSLGTSASPLTRTTDAGSITDFSGPNAIPMLTSRAWVRWSRGRLMYAGRVSRGPFMAWAQSPQGRAVVTETAARVRFALFSRARVAQRRLWRALSAAARDERVVAVIQREIDAYFERVGELAYGDGLPRTSIELHRLVVVPCVMINGAASRSIATRLGAQPVISSLEGGDELRDFFFLGLIQEIEAAIARAQPSPKRPPPAGETWISVGLNREFVWRVPFQGPAWAGHHYVFELTRQPIRRSTRKAVAEKIRNFEASLPSLSRLERSEILRRAASAA